MHLWNIKTGRTKFQSFKNSTWSECISFSPNGKYIATGSSDGTIQLWNIQTGEAAFKPFEVDKDARVSCIAFSADGKYIVACSSEGQVRLWKNGTEKAGLEQVFRGGFPITITAVAISPDRKFITFGSYRTVQLWTTETDRPDSVANLKRLGGHQIGFVESVSFSPDGKYFASCSDDCTMRIYNNNAADQTHDLRTSQATFLHHYPTGSVVTGPAETDDEGWLQYPSGELLLWVPPELHLGLYLPGIVHVVGADSIKIELSKFVHGVDWLKCQEERYEPTFNTLI